MERIPLNENRAGKTLALATLALLAVGVVMVPSAAASVVEGGPWYGRVGTRHIIFAIAAAAVLLSFSRLDYRWLARGRRVPVLPAVMLAIALAFGVLVFVPGVGHSVGGYYRWIRLGPPQYQIQFQPSELIKLSLLIFLAAWLASKDAEQIRDFRQTFLPAIGLIGLCVGLVITQDYGTATLIGVSAVVVLMLAGVRLHYFALLLLPAAAGFWAMVVRVPHRWARITTMLADPMTSDAPSAYQPRQSLLAILNGGWFGRGPGNGMQKLGFLPEDSTDFIFSVFCEEWGFVGAMLLCGLIVLWIFAVRRIAIRSVDPFGRLLAGALGFVVAIQAVGHLAVDLVIAPPTGMGLPYVSAGGTALLLMAAAAALIVSVSSARPDTEEIRAAL